MNHLSAALVDLGLRGQWQDVARHAHAIQGMAGNLGLTRLQALSQSLDEACRTGAEAEMHRLIGSFDTVIRDACAVLEKVLQ
ncbi:MAG: Hpt domain-containing protein [Rhodospirillaceae bacterium]